MKTCEKCKFWSPTPTLLNQQLGDGTWQSVLTSPLGDSDEVWEPLDFQDTDSSQKLFILTFYEYTVTNLIFLWLGLWKYGSWISLCTLINLIVVLHYTFAVYYFFYNLRHSIYKYKYYCDALARYLVFSSCILWLYFCQVPP